MNNTSEILNIKKIIFSVVKFNTILINFGKKSRDPNKVKVLHKIMPKVSAYSIEVLSELDVLFSISIKTLSQSLLIT